MKPPPSSGLSELLVHTQGIVAFIAIGGIIVLILKLLLRGRGAPRKSARRRTRRR